MPLQQQLSGCRYVTPKRCQITSSPTFCRITYNPTNYDHFKIISHNFGGFQIASHNHGFYMLQHGNMLPSFEQMFHLSEAKQRKDKGTKRKSHWTFDDAPGRQCDDAPLDFAKVWFCVEFGCVLKRENITCRYIVQYIVNKQIYIYITSPSLQNGPLRSLGLDVLDVLGKLSSWHFFCWITMWSYK